MNLFMRCAAMVLIGLPIAEHVIPGAERFLPLGGDTMVQTAIVFAGAYLSYELWDFLMDARDASKK